MGWLKAVGPRLLGLLSFLCLSLLIYKMGRLTVSYDFYEHHINFKKYAQPIGQCPGGSQKCSGHRMMEFQ